MRREVSSLRETSVPAFKEVAQNCAMQMAGLGVDELCRQLKCNRSIAVEAMKNYQVFLDEHTVSPAAFCYDGMVFKKLFMKDFSDADLDYANAHLFIGSFLYGLLRPLDGINRYRLEGKVVLPNNGQTLFDIWKPILTDWFIRRVRQDDGVLVNLASNEFRGLFDWKRVKKELNIVTPDFKVERMGILRNVTIYAKMCRGAMARWILTHRITEVKRLETFSYEGFKFVGGDDGHMLFVMHS